MIVVIVLSNSRTLVSTTFVVVDLFLLQGPASSSSSFPLLLLEAAVCAPTVLLIRDSSCLAVVYIFIGRQSGTTIRLVDIVIKTRYENCVKPIMVEEMLWSWGTPEAPCVTNGMTIGDTLFSALVSFTVWPAPFGRQRGSCLGIVTSYQTQ